MIVLMASTCLQNDCQKQPRQHLQPETEMEPEQASGVRRHKATQSERDRQREWSGARNCFYALAFSICVSLRVPFDLLALLFSTCDSDTLELVICPLPSLWDATPTPPLPSSPPLHLVHHFPSCFCVHKSCGMTESHSVMQPQHLMPLPRRLPLVFWPVQTNVLIRETHTRSRTRT